MVKAAAAMQSKNLDMRVSISRPPAEQEVSREGNGSLGMVSALQSPLIRFWAPAREGVGASAPAAHCESAPHPPNLLRTNSRLGSRPSTGGKRSGIHGRGLSGTRAADRRARG